MNAQEFAAKASPAQRQVMEAKERFLIVVTGIQAGKTTLGGAWMCSKIYADFVAGIPGDYLVAAPTVKILQQSTLPKFLEMMPKDWGEWKEGAKIFKLKWGGNIFVRSTDDPDYLEGMTIRAAWLDEAGQMKQLVWTNVQGRLSIAQGPCIMTTTPYAMGWFYRDIVKRAHRHNDEIKELGDKDIALFSWASPDNPAFPRDEFERAKATLAPAIFKRRYLGEFTQLEGLVYPDFTSKLVVDPFQIPGEWIRFGGQDFGRTNPTAVECIAEDPTDHIFYVFKEFYKAETVLKQSADFVQDQGLRRLLCDPQSAQLIAELKSTYHIGYAEAANNDIDSGIERLTALFREGRLKVFSTCTNLIEELESYHYPAPDNEGEVRDKPVAKKNHACDALRYAFSKQNGRRRGQIDPLNTLPTGRGRRYVGQVRRSDFTPDPYTGY